MATHSRREVHTRRVEFVVPAQPPYGAAWVEVMKAIHAAIAELREAGRLGPDEEPSDDTLWVRPSDEHVLVVYEDPQTYVGMPPPWITDGGGS